MTERFTIAVEGGDFKGHKELYCDDALLDAHVTNWRFQVQGAPATAERLEGWFRLPGRSCDVQTDDTAFGDLNGWL
jgi:ketosteroid isomerase-like protein